jgi:hypothetical protein
MCLFNKGIRHLYLSVLDELYGRFVRLNEKFYKVRTKDYIYCVFYCMTDILRAIIYFALAPIIIISYLPTGGYRYRYLITPYWKIIKLPKPISNEYLKPPLIIKVKKNIPFIPDKQQVIYFESCFNKVLNFYFLERYEDIYSLFKERGYNFIYIPKIIDTLGIEEAKYVSPALNEDTVISNKLIAQDISNKLLSFIDDPTPLSGGLLRYKEDEEDYYIFTYYQFANLDEVEIWKQIKTYINAVGDRIMYSITPSIPNIEPEDNADYNFDSYSRQLMDEIKERIEILKQKGINEMVLRQLFSIEAVKLSRLVITNEYKIFLPDYNNMEITMYPLPKAVFFLFLNHPEGILFKNLPDYRDELTAIYKMISGRENIDDMEKSINDVVNPTLNSINEKCSRIKEAFIRHFDESIAQNYFITGNRATPKKIELDRELIVLDDVTLKVKVVKTSFV